MLSVFEHTKVRAFGSWLPCSSQPSTQETETVVSGLSVSMVPYRVPKDGIKFLFNHCCLSLGTPDGYPEVNPLLFLFPHLIRGEIADPHRAETQQH